MTVANAALLQNDKYKNIGDLDPLQVLRAIEEHGILLVEGVDADSKAIDP